MKSPKTTDLTYKYLDGAVELHRHCFSGATSIFSLLDNKTAKLFFTQIVEEPKSYAAVLVETNYNRVIGLVYGTVQPGIQNRFLHRYLIRILWSLFKKLLINKTAWKFLWSRLCSDKSSNVPLCEYDSMLEKVGIPVPAGTEALLLAIGVHEEFRGGDNAVRLVKYFSQKVFQEGAIRIRSGVLIGNRASISLFKKLGWNIKNISDEKVSVWIDRPEENVYHEL